jgi:hypothetical protein
VDKSIESINCKIKTKADLELWDLIKKLMMYFQKMS